MLFRKFYKDIEEECKKFGRTGEEVVECKKACTKALISYIAGCLVAEAIIIKLFD